MLKDVSPGEKAPDEINVVIEIPANSSPVKYEYDKDTDMLVVDRFMMASMHYPCNYGFVPNTLSEDGDPVDVLVPTPHELRPGVVIKCRPVGILRMTDESGVDAKIVAVPVDKLTKVYSDVQEATDLPELLRSQIKHFFENYKTLEPNKWVRVDNWDHAAAAKEEVAASIKRGQG